MLGLPNQTKPPVPTPRYRNPQVCTPEHKQNGAIVKKKFMDYIFNLYFCFKWKARIASRNCKKYNIKNLTKKEKNFILRKKCILTKFIKTLV